MEHPELSMMKVVNELEFPTINIPMIIIEDSKGAGFPIRGGSSPPQTLVTFCQNFINFLRILHNIHGKTLKNSTI